MKIVLKTSLNRTYTPYTYSLRDILATEELVTCRVLVPIRNIFACIDVNSNVNVPRSVNYLQLEFLSLTGNKELKSIITKEPIGVPLDFKHFNYQGIVITLVCDAGKQQESQFSKTPYVKDLEKDQVVDLPWWMAGFLYSMDLQKVAVRFPAVYDRVHRDILLADPCAVPLQRWSSFYFDISLLLDFFDFPETTLTRRTLEEVSRERWLAVVTKALNVYNDASIEKRMPRSERDVFLVGREYKVLLEKWLRSGCIINHTGIAADLREKKQNETKLTNRWY